ncbi:MAG TPA: GMC family oxidoreductase [Bryobacteraceae bacterium]|nr:GMC family oxidoreductase [Bryobacteraceae bacterium]
MPRLSSPIREIKAHYTVLVIGSGYGGAIAASRMARAGQQVCVLERGREFQTGEYPDTDAEALAEMQAELPGGHSGSRMGLYSFHVNPDANVFVGCGLGGTSLINGNVALRPEPRVFDDPRWPAALRDDQEALNEGYRRAEEMLRPAAYPEHYPALPKLLALEQSAAHLGQACSRPPITVTFQEGVSQAGVEQHACMLCGDCITGCNYGAKNTLLFNYLPDARNFGAEIYTQVHVRRLERKDGRWVAHYQSLETGWEDFHAPCRTVSADVVVLAAGSLGSTEILLRSKAAGLPLSDQVGQHFSGNGDVLGYSFGCTGEIRGVGYGHRDPRDAEAVGPCVTGIIDMRQQPELDDGIVIQEIVTPGALAGLLPEALARTGAALGKVSTEGLGEAMAMEGEIESLSMGPYGAGESTAEHTQAYLVTTHEGGSGSMRLDHDRLRIEWPHVGDQPIFEKVNATLAEATRALGGRYLINPVWSTIFNKDLITVHPLGGCVMAADAAHGAVNHKGQVFLGNSGTAVHEGLYVCDGSAIPRSLGAPPLLTISALCERTCALMAKDRGWRIDYALPSRPAWTAPPAPLSVQFVESARDDSWGLDLTVVSDNLEELMHNPDHKARVAGHVVAPGLPGEPLLVSSGEFSMDSAGHGAYRMKLAGREGKTFHLQASREAAALHLTLRVGDTGAGAVLSRGMLRMLPQDLRRQLSTLRVSNAANGNARLQATARFGHALAGDLYDIYGSVAGGRKKRPLRVNPPTVFPFPGGKQRRLIRYEGGSHGPVLLTAGPGASSLIFTLDTIETNLLEFLFAHGCDVWLLDSADGKDHDAALAKVKEVTRAANVRVLSEGWDAPGPVELNAATRDAVPQKWRGIPIIGIHAARDVYPEILKRLS